MQPPAADDLDDLRFIRVRVNEILFAGGKGEDRRHVISDFAIDICEICEIETAMHISVPPGQQEVANAPSLTGILTGDVEQFFEGETNAIFHGQSLCRNGI